MLQSIRDRAQGVFVWLVIGAIVISFALFGISNYFSGGVDQTKVATVNGEDISVNDYRLAFVEEQSRMRQMFGEGFDIDQFEDQIKKSALQRSIERTVLSISATDSGMFVSDQQLAGRVHEIPNFQQDGKFSKSLYEQTLRQNSQSVAGFEHRLRRDLILQQFALGLSSSAFATNNDIKNTYLLEQQERQIGYMTVAANSFTKDINIDDAAVKDYYDKNQGQYQTQEQVSVSYLELNVNDLTGGIEVSDDEVEEYFEEQQERFMTGEERKARHILISVDDKTSDADAKKKINDLHAKIQSGESFEELAKKHSQDPGSAEQGGDLGFFGKGIMDKVFEDTAFALNKGEISKPIRSEFGYHIIKLEEIKAGKGKNLGDVRDELLKELKRSKAERVYAEKAEKLVNLTYENPESLEPAADELGLTIQTTTLFSKMGGPGIVSNPKVRDAAFSNEVLNEGLNSEAIEISDSHSVVVRLKEHKPAKLKPLDEVKSAIVSQLKNTKAMVMAKEKGEKILADVQSGKSPTSLAKTHKLTWNSEEWVKRTGSKVPGNIVNEAFKAPKPEFNPVFRGVAAANGDYTIIGIKSVRAGKDEVPKEEKERLSASIANANGLDQLGMIVKSLETKAEIQRFNNNL